MRRADAAAALLALTGAVGCSVRLSGDDLLMCNAAQLLTASMIETEGALAVEVGGRPGEAAEQAVQALGLAEGAARILSEVDQATQAEALWQDLIRAYKNAAQAASSALPDFQELRGTGGESLQAARGALDGARPGLPPDCFVVPPS